MKYKIAILVVLILVTVAYAADKKWSIITENTTVADADEMLLIDIGTGDSERITVLNLFDTIDTSLELLTILTNETGTGALVFAISPTLVTPILGVIASGVGTTLTALNGENIQNDTIDDDSIDWADCTFADFDFETAWRMWHSDAAGDVTEIILGANGTFLESNGAAANPAFRALVDGDVPDNITIDLATLATTVTVSDDEATNDNQEIVFTTDNTNLESDGDFHYNPSTGTVTATQFSGGGAGLTGTLTAYDDIADPDAASSITFADGETVTWATSEDSAGPFFLIQNSDADLAANTYLLDLDYSVDDNQANADYLRGQDAGGVVFSIQQNGDTLSTGTIQGTTLTGTAIVGPSFDAAGAEDMDYGSVDVTDHTFTTDDMTLIMDGGITVSTGDFIKIGTTQWNSADEIDGTKIKDADYGDVDVSAGGAWTLDTDSVADNEIDYANVTFADFDYETNWKMWHSNAAGDVTEITLGANGTFMESNGAAAAPAFRVLADGDVPDNITINLATLATTVTVSDDEATADNQEIVFTTDNANLESDGDFHYNPSTGTVTATEFVGGGAGITHNVASHSDTSATGTELDTLTDNSIADTLHRHTELVASDGTPDPALSVDSVGRVGMGTSAPDGSLEIRTGNSVIRIRDTGDTATATTSFVEFGGTTAAAFSRTGYIGDSQVANTDIILQAEDSDLLLGDSTSESVLTLSGGDVTATGALEAATLTEGGNAVFNAVEGGTFTGGIIANANLSVGNATTTAGVLTLLEDDDDGANFASFMVPALAANTVYTLPPDDGDNTEVLQTDGGGTLTWVANAGGGAVAWDDIGDPDAAATVDFTTYTQTIDIGVTDTGGPKSGLILDVTGLGAGTTDVIALEITTATDDDTDYIPIAIYDDSGVANDLLFRVNAIGEVLALWGIRFGIGTATMYQSADNYISFSETSAGDRFEIYLDSTDLTLLWSDGVLNLRNLEDGVDAIVEIEGKDAGEKGILRVMSDGDDKYIELYHDDTDAQIVSSSGDLIITPTGDDLLVDAGLTVGSSTEAGDNNLRVEGTSTLVGVIENASNIKSNPKHLIFNVFNPSGVQSDDTQVCIWPETDANLTVTKITVTLDAAGNEVAGDLKYADTFIGLANPVVINVFDTTSGVLEDSSITSGSVAAGKAIYIQFDSAPNAAITQMCIDVVYDYD